MNANPSSPSPPQYPYYPYPPPPPPAVPARKPWWKKLLMGLIVLYGLTVVLQLVAPHYFSRLFGIAGASASLEYVKADIVVLKIEGVIFDSEPIVKKMVAVAKNPAVKAVVLRINSPGGAIGPTQEIHSQVKKLAEKKKVVVSMGAFAASGGYYISCPAERIFANPGTITGSIGVLMEHISIEELLSFAKISAQTLKSGEMKDAGSILRQMKPEEKQYLENILSNMHEQFKKVVLEGRKKISAAEIDVIADGRAYTGEQALGLHLVDELGTLEDALDYTQKLLDIKGEPVIFYPKDPSALERFLNGEVTQDELWGMIHSFSKGKVLYLGGI